MRQRSKHLSSKNKTLVKTEKFLRNAADCEQMVKGLRMSEIPDGRRETSPVSEQKKPTGAKPRRRSSVSAKQIQEADCLSRKENSRLFQKLKNFV